MISIKLGEYRVRLASKQQKNFPTAFKERCILFTYIEDVGSERASFYISLEDNWRNCSYTPSFHMYEYFEMTKHEMAFLEENLVLFDTKTPTQTGTPRAKVYNPAEVIKKILRKVKLSQL